MKGKKLITIISIVCILAVMLCIPAFATVTETDGDGFALYNGVKLELVPDAYNSSYVYFTISILTSADGNIPAGTYVYRESTAPYKYTSQHSTLTGEGSPSGSKTRVYYFVENSWTFTVAAPMGGAFGASQRIVWSNYDFYDLDGNFVLASSAPIPLDGYNIIEWDGDTTGLPSTSAGFYKVANYFEVPSSAYVVFNRNGTNYVGSDIVSPGSYAGVSWQCGSSSVLVDAVQALLNRSSYEDGIYFYDYNNTIVNLLAYRTVETPPDEGGGEPDDPQPPFWAAELYHKLHLSVLTPQQQ